MLLSLTLLLALAPSPADEDIEAIHERARLALAQGRLDAATQDYLWLWNESLALWKADVDRHSSWPAMRTTYVATEIGNLADRHEPAAMAFDAIFARLDEQVAAGAEPATWLDWIELGKALGHTDTVVAWVREHRDEQGALRVAADPRPGHVPPTVAGTLVEAFVEEHLLAEAGRLTDLVPLVDHELRTIKQLRQMPEAPPAVVENMKRSARGGIKGLYAAALAAGRPDQAAGVAAALLAELDDVESRILLVRAANEAGNLAPEHVRWLVEAEARVEDDPDGSRDLAQDLVALRRDLDRALDPKGASDTLPPRRGAFTPISLAEAKALTAKDQRLLIVDFTATWCGPCKRMDKTTWSDTGVQAWIDEHGLALQVDVDEQPALKREFRVSGMPTIVALRGGEEIGRFLGYRTADQLLTWLAGLANAP